MHEGLPALNTTLLHILFIVNTVKTISAVRDHKERKERVLLLLWSLNPETGALPDRIMQRKICNVKIHYKYAGRLSLFLVRIAMLSLSQQK